MLLKIIDDGNRSPLANQNGLATEGGPKRAQRRLRARAFGRNQIRLAAVARLDLEANRRRTMVLQVSLGEGKDAFRFLVWHEAEGEFSPRPGGDNGLASFVLIAAGQAVNLDRRPGAAPFGRAVSALAEQSGHTKESTHGFIAVRQPRQLP